MTRYSSSQSSRSHRRPRRTQQTKSRRISSIESPRSGRWIAIGGPAYRDLLRLGYTDSELKRGGVQRRKRAQRRYSSTAGRSRPSRAQRRSRISRASKSSTRGRGRGSRSRGWGKAAPRRGRPRHSLMKKCGKKCFLLPEHEGFPVCASLESSRRSGSGSCDIDCRGVQAAYVRARQYGYKNVAKAARKLYDEKCK